MCTRSLFACLAVIALLSFAGAPQALAQNVMENPPITMPASSWDTVKDQKPGDFVVHKDSFGNETRQEVHAIDETAKTITIDMPIAAANMITRMTYDCTGPEPEEQEHPEGEEVKVETSEGDETITAGGTEYKCHYYQTKSTSSAGETNVKIWYSKDVPMVGFTGSKDHGGMVKTETQAGGQNFSSELVKCGRGG
ncbi:MAG: hypothetical protein HY720_20385 [Planctomycetes bacterium]|nr:hypothetical protein [Planctomycetota bacterium]